MDDKIKEIFEPIRRTTYLKNNNTEEKRIAPNQMEILITVVNRRKAEYYADFIQSFDVNMQILTLAKNKVTESTALQYFGLTDDEKIVIFSFIKKEKMNEIMQKLQAKFKSIKGSKAVAFCVPFSSMIGKLAFGFLSNDERMIEEATKHG